MQNNSKKQVKKPLNKVRVEFDNIQRIYAALPRYSLAEIAEEVNVDYQAVYACFTRISRKKSYDRAIIEAAVRKLNSVGNLISLKDIELPEPSKN